jgi:uncharacterized membrane protein YqgA involved in biofilm formation
MDKRQQKRRSAMVFLIIGFAFLAIGISTDNTAFSYAAIVFVLIALVLGGRFFGPKRP